MRRPGFEPGLFLLIATVLLVPMWTASNSDARTSRGLSIDLLLDTAAARPPVWGGGPRRLCADYRIILLVISTKPLINIMKFWHRSAAERHADF